MKLIHIAALCFLAFAPFQAQAGNCHWTFTVNNLTDKTLTLYAISTRVTVYWKTQWNGWGAEQVFPGEKEVLSIAGSTNRNTPAGYSFSSDYACNASKKIDFEVFFQCKYSEDGDAFRRVALNRVRDGEHTIKITKCKDVTTG